MSDSTTPREPTIEVRWPQPGAALVVLGSEHDLYSSDSLQRTLDESLAVCRHLIIDISAAEFIGSTVIGVLVSAGQRAAEDDHRFTSCWGRLRKSNGPFKLRGSSRS